MYVDKILAVKPGNSDLQPFFALNSYKWYFIRLDDILIFGCKIGCKKENSLKISEFCGERGRRYQVTILRNSLILNSCTSQNFIFFALLWRRTGARQNAPNHWNSESLLNEFTYFKKSMTAVMPENRVFASEFGSSYCTFPGLHQTVLMPAHGGFFKPWSGVQIIIRIVIPYSYKRSFTSHDVWNPIGEMVL